MSERVRIGATDLVAREAAESAAFAGASALGCALAGYFAAAGSHPGVLLSPLGILLSGFGARRAFDGRLRQPGLGAQRPRGFLDSDPVPDAAYLALPSAFLAAFVAQSYDETRSRARVLKAGIAAAKRLGAGARLELLDRADSHGALALRGSSVERELLRVAGPAQGGLLTLADFQATPDVDLTPLVTFDGLLAPFADSDAAPVGTLQGIVTQDLRGTLVALAYQSAEHGFPLFDGELIAPRAAIPVRRGVPRTKPGSWLPAPCPVQIELGPSDVPLRATSPRLGLAVGPLASP